MSPHGFVLVLTLAVLPLQPTDGGVILDGINSFLNSFVPKKKVTTTAAPPEAEADYVIPDPMAAPTNAFTADNATLVVMPPSVESTTAKVNQSQSKSFIVVPDLQCGSGFRKGRDGRCRRIL